MYQPIYTKRFEKEIKLCQKRQKDLDKIKAIIDKLIYGERLPLKNRDHNLTGNLVGHRECHIESDWLLVYRYEGKNIIFVRTGTHSDLFR